MLNSIKSFATLALVLPAALAGPLVPRRDTPNFYLIANNPGSSYHLKPLLVNSNDASLASGTPGKFYLEGQRLKVDGIDPNFPPTAFISFGVTSTGCTPDGPMNIITGSSSNKCAKNFNFYLSSYDQNSQLGAKLVFDWTGSFYACSGGPVKYSSTAIPGCDAITLWTAPANP